MTNNVQITAETEPEYDPVDTAIVNIVTAHPDATNNQIANKLQSIGSIHSHTTVYNRLKKSEYLRGDIERIRQNHREQISRELMPLALKVTRKALKSKDLSDKDKHAYVSTVIKSDLGEQPEKAPQATINITALQAIVEGNMG